MTDPKIIAELRELFESDPRDYRARDRFINLLVENAASLLADSERLGEVEKRLRLAVEGLELIKSTLGKTEINPNNYNHDEVCSLNAESTEAYLIARDYLTKIKGTT